CTRAARKIGFVAPRAKEWSWLAVKERVAVPSPRPHRSDEGLLLVSRVAGRDLARPPHPILPVDAAARARAAAWLASHNEDVVAEKPRIVLAPGTSAFAAFKRWPAARFAELAERLHLAGHRVIVSTGPGEGELGLQVCERSGALWFDGAAHGLATALEVLRCADVWVAVDSGPLHLAQAVGVPVVGVFGPKDPRVYGPRLQPSLVLRYPTACTPCGLRRCALPTCVQAVAVDDVYEATQRVLAARREASAQ
ncbi:MAG TPA: glycosyltransferase family 9 protein, partial [Planctomycetota bacterium]|nr:glycosyltransferase family 9 protein [Planctomycetota bacterium]